MKSNNIFSNHWPILFRFVSVFLLLVSSAFAQSKFVRLTLPLEVSVEVPSNWWVLSGDLNTTIEAAGEAARNLAGLDMPRGKKVNLFRANSMPRTTYAGIAVNATDSEISPDEIAQATKNDLKEMEHTMVESGKRGLAVQNLELLESLGVEHSLVSDHQAITFRYRRSGPQGPVMVVMTRLFLGSKEISLNLSYRESEAILWKPVIEYIRNSLTVGKGA